MSGTRPVVKAVIRIARNAPPPANPPRTEGLTPLDRDRASSIADEGGTSAAEVEGQRPPRPTVAVVPGKDAIDPDETPTQPWRRLTTK